MSFARGGESGGPDDLSYHDPLASGVLGGWTGLGDAAADIGGSAATGAAIGTAVPIVGTAVGGAVGAVVGILKGLLGGDKTGLPRKPVNDREYAHALAMKWFNLYLDDWTSTDDYGYWTNEILKDGPERAWKNFSTSKEPIQKNAAQKAADLTPQYGGPFVVNAGDVIPGSNVGVTTYTPPGTATTPYHPVSVAGQQASIIPGVSNGVLLIGAAAIVGAMLFSRRRR